VTYPSRAIPLLAPQFERLPSPVLAYLRLVGPAVLGAIAAVEVLVRPAGEGFELVVGPEALAVVVCAIIVAWRRNLALGLVAAVGLIALARAAGIA
jgi:branched-subunit amino acid transport protein